MSSLLILGRVINWINPDGLGVQGQPATNRYKQSWDGQDSRLQLLMVEDKRLAFRVIDRTNKVHWEGLSPVFNRIGPGPLMLGAKWDSNNFSIAVNSRVIGSSDEPISSNPIVFGDWDIEDQTLFYQKESSEARNRRRLHPQQISPVQLRRLCELFIGEIQNLKSLTRKRHRNV